MSRIAADEAGPRYVRIEAKGCGTNPIRPRARMSATPMAAAARAAPGSSHRARRKRSGSGGTSSAVRPSAASSARPGSATASRRQFGMPLKTGVRDESQYAGPKP